MSISNVRSSMVDPAITGVSSHEKIGSDSAASELVKKSVQGESRAGPISREEVNTAVDSLHGLISMLQTRISFSISEETDQIIIKVINRETDEVIRQIPPEELVSLQAKMEELTGIIFNKVV